MIYELFKINESNESVFDVSEILKVELKNDAVQSLNTKWDVSRRSLCRGRYAATATMLTKLTGVMFFRLG